MTKLAPLLAWDYKLFEDKANTAARITLIECNTDTKQYLCKCSSSKILVVFNKNFPFPTVRKFLIWRFLIGYTQDAQR